MKSERLDWLADNPFYTKRFAFFVGRRCRDTAIKEVAEELFLDWHTVKELDKQYMTEQLRRAGNPAPRVIGIDEISIGKGHSTASWSATWIARRAIWFGGQDRSEASMDEFYAWLGPEKSRQNPAGGHGHVESVPQLHPQGGPCPAGVDPLRQVPRPRPLQDAMDKVRKSEYARLTGPGRRFIKGQKYALLSHWENLSLEGRKALKLLVQRQQAFAHGLSAQRILRSALGLRVPAGPDASSTTGATAFKWQRLKPYEKFAA